jgi:hypothetical protein
MSRVTAEEIVDFVSESIDGGIYLDDGVAGMPMPAWEAVSAYLIDRHTRTTARATMIAIGRSGTGTTTPLKGMKARVEALRWADLEFRRLLDRIETRIDDLHETRIARVVPGATVAA